MVESMKDLRGIEPVIATIIILAVTVAVAVAVIGWMLGLFGATVGGTEQLQIMPDSNITVTTNGTSTVYLHVLNKGSDVTIYKIEVVGLGECTGIQVDGESTEVVKAGQNATVTCQLSKNATAGAVYTVKVYTKTGNIFTATVQAKQATQ